MMMMLMMMMMMAIVITMKHMMQTRHTFHMIQKTIYVKIIKTMHSLKMKHKATKTTCRPISETRFHDTMYLHTNVQL